MQNRYVADLGDFGKYGSLKFLVEKTGFRLGVNWYLVDPEELNEQSRNDGKKTKYLYAKPEKYTSCDEKLYYQLKSIIDDDKRSIKEVESKNILPAGTIFYAEKLSFIDVVGKEARISQRKSWVEKGLKKLQGCEIVFFDPDNGFEVVSYKRYSNKGVKFVFYDEIVEYYKRCQSLIVYQHRDMKPEEEYYKRFKRLKDYFPDLERIFGLRYSARDFIFILQKEQYDLIDKATNCFLASPRGRKHFFEKWEMKL